LLCAGVSRENEEENGEKERRTRPIHPLFLRLTGFRRIAIIRRRPFGEATSDPSSCRTGWQYPQPGLSQTHAAVRPCVSGRRYRSLNSTELVPH
jgi:hypothetical protein